MLELDGTKVAMSCITSACLKLGTLHSLYCRRIHEASMPRLDSPLECGGLGPLSSALCLVAFAHADHAQYSAHTQPNATVAASLSHNSDAKLKHDRNDSHLLAFDSSLFRALPAVLCCM